MKKNHGLSVKLYATIFTTNGGHLGFSDFYKSDFDRLFLVIDYIQ